MIYIHGRKVKIQTGQKSQTVNVCTESNNLGQYDYVVRLRPPFIDETTLLMRDFASLEDLVKYLQTEHQGIVEIWRGSSRSGERMHANEAAGVTAAVQRRGTPYSIGRKTRLGPFFIPTTGAEDWRSLLADPEGHWRTGYSARTLAMSWEAARGFPPEVVRIFRTSAVSAFEDVDLLLALPEYKVPLPGGSRPSQNDIFILAKDRQGLLLAATIEGKVDEAFGETLDSWLKTPDAVVSDGKRKRLAFLQEQLGLEQELAGTIRYQLLHRMASAVIEATRFNARSAVMLVHSFSPSQRWFTDYAAFVKLFGPTAEIDQLVHLRTHNGIDMYAGWVSGDLAYLEM